MKITTQFLIDNDACEEGVEAFERVFGDGADLKDVAAYGLREGGEMLDHVMWLLPRCMNKEQCVRYAVFAAESVLPVFEREYPDDKRPRAAIDAAKAWLAEPCSSTAAARAARAAEAAARLVEPCDSTAWAARAAARAARAAEAEAWLVEPCDSTAWAARAAAWAAEAAWAARAAWAEARADKDLEPALVAFALEMLEGK